MIKNKLSELMGKKRVIMAEIARMTGLRKATLSSIYHDKCKAVSFETMSKLCWALECNLEDLFEYIPDEEL